VTEVHAPGLRGERIVVTGVTGQVAGPIARALVRDNDVWGVARFKDAVARAALEDAGVRCVAHDFSAAAPLDGVPADPTVVLNFAVVKSGRWARDLEANAQGAGRLVAHCRGARAFLHCSSTAVYAPNGGEPMRESDPLGDHHRSLMPTYSISKIAAEQVVQFAAAEHGVPTTIARLAVPYGDGGGWPAFHLAMMRAGQAIPLHPDGSRYSPIHDDDLLRTIPGLLAAASVPATVVNWAGTQAVGIEEWCRFLAELEGLEAKFELDEHALPSAVADTTRMGELVGPTAVDWRDGMRRMAAAHG